MNQFKHILTFELSSFGAALSVINHFVDDKAVKVFEVSPCGSAAVLILLGQDVLSLQILKSEAQARFRSQILESSIVEYAHGELLPAYLSQNKTGLSTSMVFLEGASVAKGISLGDFILKAGHTIIDFRIVRTNPKNVILTVGTETLSYFENFDSQDFKKSYVDKVQPSLKAFFEVLP